jgi:hypothetical protein
MTLEDFQDWIDAFYSNRPIWYVKRLSANDTLANGTHQAGPYIPKGVLFEIFPSLNDPNLDNPKQWFGLSVDSHDGQPRQVCATWYNNRLRGGTRDEARLTNFGGGSSPLLDPESTGALVVFAFRRTGTDCENCNVWVCANEAEEALLEEKTGPVDPGQWRFLAEGDSPDREGQGGSTGSCWLSEEEMPPEWLDRFPSGESIVEKTIELRPFGSATSLDRLLQLRRDCEYNIFRSVEEVYHLPSIRRGFNTMDEFLLRAQTILQSRKSRSGRSLELHARAIFRESDLRDDINFSWQAESEEGKKPDFLFPSAAAYRDPSFPAEKLRMLAVKTTCKDRWRQIINEADRIAVKHLLTLQEGVSENQYREMMGAGVRLVVPAALHSKYPESIRPSLLTLESFVRDVRPVGSG